MFLRSDIGRRSLPVMHQPSAQDGRLVYRSRGQPAQMRRRGRHDLYSELFLQFPRECAQLRLASLDVTTGRVPHVRVDTLVRPPMCEEDSTFTDQRAHHDLVHPPRQAQPSDNRRPDLAAAIRSLRTCVIAPPLGALSPARTAHAELGVGPRRANPSAGRWSRRHYPSRSYPQRVDARWPRTPPHPARSPRERRGPPGVGQGWRAVARCQEPIRRHLQWAAPARASARPLLPHQQGHLDGESRRS